MKIDDFGYILPGARKHKYEEWKRKLALIPDQELDGALLSESFPVLPYTRLLAEGVDAETVAALRALRDTLSFTSTGRRKQPHRSEVAKHRSYAVDLLDGAVSVADVVLRFQSQFSSTTQGTLQQIIAYHVEFGHDLSFWNRDQRSQVAKKPSGRKFWAYRSRLAGQHFVAAHVGREVVPLKNVASFAEAKVVIEQEAAELLKALNDYLAIPALRSEQNRRRLGPDWRPEGGNVDPTFFSGCLPFRGVQFGKHVENSRRQNDLNEAFDACHDLAAILCIAPAAVTLCGTLGLAFGARGHGGKDRFIAHYELADKNINITKVKGAGCFAHEWWHALDNHIAGLAEEPLGLVTSGLRRRVFLSADVRFLVEELSTLVAKIRTTRLPVRSRNLDRKRSKPYFRLTEEITARAFEAWVLHELKGKGQINDWLVNLQPWPDSATSDASGTVLEESSYPYPRADEMPVIAAAFDHLFRQGGPMHAYLAGLTDIDRAEAA